MAKLRRYKFVEESPPRTGLARLVDAVRGYWSGPLTANSPEIARLFGGRPVSSGVAVNEHTALNYSAVWAAVQLISSDVAALPLVLLKRNKEGGKDRFDNHPLYRLLHDAPNPEMTSMNWRRTMQAHALTWGNGYSEIVRDQADRPTELWPITPDRVTPYRRTPTADLEYRVSNASGGETYFPARDILHLAGLGFDGSCGYSVVHRARESIGLGLAAERFGGSFYGNGATFGGVISFPGDPTELAKKNFRETMDARHQGVQNAHRLLAVYGGAKYERFGIPPNDAQFLETRQFQVTEIARWFNVPPHKLGDMTRTTNNTVEAQNIDYYVSALLPWLRAWEQEMMLKLVAPLERNQQIIEHVVEGLLRGDSAARGEFYSKLFSIGAITPNEIREIEGRNKIPGGDEPFVALNLIPLSKVGDWVGAQIDAKKPAPTPPAPALPPGNPNKQREDELVAELALARKKAQDEEDAKDRHVTEGLAALRAEQAAHLATRAAGDTEAARLTAQATSLGTDLATTVRDLETARALTGDADQRTAVVRAELLAEQAAHGATAAQVRQLQASVEALTQDVSHARTVTDGLQSSLAAAEARATAAVDEATVRTSERDAAIARAEQAEADGVPAQAQAVELTAAVEQAQAGWELARAETSVANAVIVELRTQVATLTADADTRQNALLEAREQLAAAKTLNEEESARQSDALEAHEADAENLHTAQLRLAAAGAAVRDVLLDSLQWLIEREAERARRAQGSPDKLRKWVETFYPAHDELCRKILRPSVRAWLACTGQTTETDAVLETYVREHIEHSIRQLQFVAGEHDADTLAPALEKLLRRWEADRAPAAADRLCREAA